MSDAGTGVDGSMSARLGRLAEYHRKQSGVSATSAYQAPGRVNLLGEHTDYSGGFCMPAALNFNMLVTASPRADGRLRLHSLDLQETMEFDLKDLKHPPKGHWSAYCAGVAWSLRESGIEVQGAELSLSGDVPLGSGLSSSASIEVATATALLALSDASMPKAQLALACQRAENDYVGAPCGIMDQFISVSGVRGNALAIDTRALTAELAPLPDDLRLIVCNSLVRHSNDDGKYGARRREVEEAAHALGLLNPEIHQLRDATLADLQARRGAMSQEAFLRARHVISDSQRVIDGLACLRAGDQRGFGVLMTEAHISFRDDFAASCDQCDLLVRLALELEGCLGSRLTGGGFGGCTVSLVDVRSAESFSAALQEQFRLATGVTPPVFVCEIADGAGSVSMP